jgi:hypothetical protein
MNVEFAFDRDQFTNELMLPSDISASDSKQINKLHIKFGDIFKPEEPSIIVITDVLDGVLFRLFSLKNGNITNLHTYNNLKYLRSMRQERTSQAFLVTFNCKEIPTGKFPKFLFNI